MEKGPSGDTTVISLRLPNALKRMLDDYAQTEQRSRNAVIVDLLSGEMTRHAPDNPASKRKALFKSLKDRAVSRTDGKSEQEIDDWLASLRDDRID